MSELANHAVLGASYRRGYDQGREDIKTPKQGKLDASGQITAEAMREAGEWIFGIQMAHEFTTYEQWVWDTLLSEGSDKAAVASVRRAIEARPEMAGSMRRLEGKAFIEGLQDAYRDYVSNAMWTEFLDMNLYMENQLRRLELSHLGLLILLLPGAANLEEVSKRLNAASEEWRRTVAPRCNMMFDAVAVGGVQ